MKTCPDCGERVYEYGCVNCNEADYIDVQAAEDEAACAACEIKAITKLSIGHGLTYLECPCCGDDGAESDGEGCFYDGQALICGCPGLVSVDADDSDDPWINSGDEPCAKCANEQKGTP